MAMLLIEMDDSSVQIMQVSPSAVSEQEIAKWRALHPGYVRHREIDPASVPADRTFRDAWDASLCVNMEKAREIHRNRMREARAPKLQVLDVAYVRALEGGDAAGAQTIAAQKQTLRDVTVDPSIEAASTPEELKAVWPQCLK